MAINLIAINELLLLSKVPISEAIEYRKRKRLNKDEAIATTTTTTTNTKTLTPFQAERVLLISKLRELVISGRSPIAIGE